MTSKTSFNEVSKHHSMMNPDFVPSKQGANPVILS